METADALIVIDCSAAAVIVRGKVLDTTPFCVAVMLLVPMASPVARPLALIFTVAGVELIQVAVLVRFCVVPSLKVPVAAN